MKRKAEGIALLSVYNDDDEDEEEEEQQNAGAAGGLNSAAGLDPAAGSDSGSAPGDLLAEPETEAENKAAEEPPSDEPDRGIAESVAAAGGQGQEREAADERLLNEFLPPPSTSKCSDELQARFVKFLALKEAGKCFNEELRNSKGYRNPDFLQRAVLHQGVDQIGSCFRKEVFDPYGYDPEDFYDVLSQRQNQELERRAQELKQNRRMEFVRSMQPGTAWINPAAAAAPTAAAAATAAIVPKLEGRTNKKSKWDKVEPEGRSVPGLPNALAMAMQAAALMTANQQQQKRN